MKLIQDEEECEATMAVTEENQSQVESVPGHQEDSVLTPPQVMVQAGSFAENSTQTIQEGIVPVSEVVAVLQL